MGAFVTAPSAWTPAGLFGLTEEKEDHNASGMSRKGNNWSLMSDIG